MMKTLRRAIATATVLLLMASAMVRPCAAQQSGTLPPARPRDLTYRTFQNQALTVDARDGVLKGARLPNRAALTAQCVSCTSDPMRLTNGTLRFNPDGGFTYTPNDDAFGIDRFEYIIRNGTSEVSPPATVTLVVIAPLESERSVINATFYVGEAIDTFSADELHRYLNPEAGSQAKSRFIAGVDFEYRVGGLLHKFMPVENGPQVWLFGETVHGVRSADVNCGTPDKPPVCGQFTVDTASERALYILRNASSLEAFSGVRVEFLDVQRGTEDMAKVYVKGQVGFLAVDGSGSDVAMNNLVSIGIAAIRGRLTGSYFEIGTGQTELYVDHPAKRLKIDGHLAFPFGATGVGGFAQMTVDAAKGADSIQTYFGIELDVARLFGGGAGDARHSRRR
jgi:hypothetical protein